MSGDFISRKALMEKVMQEEYDNDIHKYGRAKAIHHGEYQHFYKTISEMPTAYDVDKVIEEIEKIISSYELCVETSLKEIEKNGEDKMSFEICSLHNNRGYLSGLRKALEIVKSGGVSDD